jgi:hypothetical protein
MTRVGSFMKQKPKTPGWLPLKHIFPDSMTGFSPVSLGTILLNFLNVGKFPSTGHMPGRKGIPCLL